MLEFMRKEFGVTADAADGRRKRRLRGPLALLVLTVAVVGASSLGGGHAGAAQDDPLRVTTTIGQIGDAVRNLGGDRIEVEALMGPGVDPHLYKASEGDVEKLLEADIIFYNGLNLEGKMADILEQLARERPVIAVTENIPEDALLEPPEFRGQYDPHVWFDPTLWAMAVERIQDGLAEVDPDHSETYRANADAYLAQIRTLDEEAATMLGSIPQTQRVLVTAHDAFNYFGRRYGVEVVGLQGISTETEAGVDDVQRLAEMIAERGIPAIFVESSVSPRTIEAVQAAARDRGHEVAIGGQLFSDAMGEAGTPEGTYVGMFRRNVETITAALGGTVAPSAATPPAA